MPAIDRTFFFNEVRGRPFGGSMEARHVAGCNAILDYWESEHSGGDTRHVAYLLGTTYHETAHRMEAINEYGTASYFNNRYGPGTAVGRSLGNTQPGDGNRFHGRGFVQLTGRANYTDWGNRLGLDLTGNPELGLDVDVATKILVEGSMMGTFTGVSLPDYFNASKNDWYHARQVINRLDKAQHIADLGKQFWAAISYEGTGQLEQAPFRTVLRVGSSGEDVRFMQRYLGLVTDGSFGPMTDDVVRAFQSDQGLTADGVVGLRTWEKLLASQIEVRDMPSDDNPVADPTPAPTPVGNRPLLRFSSRGEHVREVQELLGVTVDGHFGPVTLEAVQAFQRDNGLQSDGIIGRNTWMALLNQ